MKEKWDERYASSEFAYGKQANNYLKEQLLKIPVGSILFPAEGEGRNAVFAATLGWQVFAFDQSVEGKKKADNLAQEKSVTIEYKVGEFQLMNYKDNQFDAIALIYAHFPALHKSDYHKILSTYLRPGGILIFEAFSKRHLDYVNKNPKVGGPKEIDMLFSLEEVKFDFHAYEILELAEHEIELSEGIFHNGLGSVIRFVGRKK